MATVSPDTATFDDEEPKKGFGKLSLRIPELKAKKKMFGKAEAENAQFNANMFQTRQISFDATINDGGKTIKYHFSKALEADIVPDQCYLEVKDKYVILCLKKAKNGSWAQYERDLTNIY